MLRPANARWAHASFPPETIRILLIVWFAVIGLGNLYLLGTDAIGVDTRIYYRGSAAWLAGGDPWQAVASYTVSYGTNHYHFAGFPTTVVLFAPLTLLPEPLAVAGWVVLGVLAAVYVVRALHLPWWWLLFPPLLEGVWAGNPGIHLLALLVSGSSVALAIAPVLKAYAGVPPFVLGRLRPLLGAVALGALTIVIAPDLWRLFLGQYGFVSERLMSESAGGYAASAYPPLYLLAIPAVLALLAVDRKAAAWLAVIALWPASEFHYQALALPVIAAAGPIAAAALGAGLALPVRGLPVLVVAAYAAARLARGRLRRRAAAHAERDERPGVPAGTAV